jgi:hypothetical protein
MRSSELWRTPLTLSFGWWGGLVPLEQRLRLLQVCRHLVLAQQVLLLRHQHLRLLRDPLEKMIWISLSKDVWKNENRNWHDSVADPDPGSGAFLTPGSGMGKKMRSWSGMNISDHISESLETGKKY